MVPNKLLRRKFQPGRNLYNWLWRNSYSLNYNFLTPIAIGAIFLVMLGCHRGEVKDFWASRSSPIFYTSVLLPPKGSKWAPRRSSAEITQETELELKRKGYRKIGEIKVKKFGGYCYYDTKCVKKFVLSPTKRLLREAAKRGGDLVLLTNNNVLQKEQKRIFQNERPFQASEYNQTDYPSVNGSTSPGYLQIKVSSGTVWRKIFDDF